MYSAINGRCFSGFSPDTYIVDKSLMRQTKIKPLKILTCNDRDCKFRQKGGCTECKLAMNS